LSEIAPDADEGFMRWALEEAERCIPLGDVPVGAVMVRGGEIIFGAGNRREHAKDPTAHAEMIAMQGVARILHSWHLDGCTLYVTLEPCAMCAGAIVLSRLDRVVYGAADPKAGFAGSLGDIVRDPRLNHRAEVTSGVLADDSSEILRAFFRDRR
jgi:tRNA(adenine34) deaminase